MTKAIENIESDAVGTIADRLNQVVADSYGLLGQIHLAHWNVEGRQFLSLHELFQTQYEELFVGIDEIAERVRSLGKYTEGGIKRLGEMSRVPEGPSATKVPENEWISSIILGHETVIQSCLECRDHAGESGDKETEDLMIARNQVHQKAVWMLNSFLK